MVDLPQLLQRNGDLDSIGSLSGVEIDVGGLLIENDSHLVCDLFGQLIETV